MMNNKKMIKDTVGVVIGGVGITEANKIEKFGPVLGTTMGAGMVHHMTKKKKGGY